MKNSIYFLMFTASVASTLFTSCVSSKKTQASNARIQKLQKDSIDTHRKLVLAEKKNTSATHEKVTVVEKKVTVKKESTVVVNPEIVTPELPAIVATHFKSRFPMATGIVWTQEMPLVKLANKDTRDYKANFLIKESKSSAIYSKKGELIETREQILPDQLPQNVYTAIKNKYADAQIVSATTYKNSKTNGSYTAIIKTEAFSEITELILMDNGTFVE